MKIDSSVIGMESARRYTSSSTRVGRYSVKDYRENTAGNLKNGFSGLLNTGKDQEETEQAAKNGTNVSKNGDTTQTGEKNRGIITMENVAERLQSVSMSRIRFSSSADAMMQFRQKCMDYLFSLFFGDDKLKNQYGDNTSDSLSATDLSGTSQSSGQQFILYSEQVSLQETEETSFTAQGIARTADGREISFNMDVGMSRSFAAYYEQNYGLASIQTCDPLVINLDGNPAGLSDQKFFFDIDGDGEQDNVSMLEKGSGYLALDKNNDGQINDGNELFGTASGNGFADLAAYDEDGNGWIDENDAVWSKLKIWCKTEDGTDQLYTLADKGVGAICLQNSATDFELKGGSGQTNGYIRSTGVFLYENGEAGSVQHVDLAR